MVESTRRIARVKLRTPLRGQADGKPMFVADISVRGLRIIHQQPLGAVGTRVPMVFEWEGNRVQLTGELRWSKQQKSGSGPTAKTLIHSGFLITEIGVASASVVREIVLSHVTAALDEQKANARGLPAIAPNSFQTGGGTEFIRHEYVAGAWRETKTKDPNQPSNGFTVGADHSREEMEMLREAYAAGDFNSRKMIREMAAASIDTAGIPTRRYTP